MSYYTPKYIFPYPIYFFPCDPEPNANPDILQWIALPVIPLDLCGEMMEEFYQAYPSVGETPVDEYHVCLLDDQGIQGSCVVNKINIYCVTYNHTLFETCILN